MGKVVGVCVMHWRGGKYVLNANQKACMEVETRLNCGRKTDSKFEMEAFFLYDYIPLQLLCSGMG
jgi:hypothetical protein